jgi:hypothetical protein
MRKTTITLTALGLVAALAAAAPTQAEARDWGHRGGSAHQWRGHNSGAAIGFGILGGILTGAAIASSQASAAPPVYYYQPPSPYYVAPGYTYATPYGYSGYGYTGYGYYR